MVRVFANGPGDRGSIPGRVIPKTRKIVLDATLLNTQHYKVWIKDMWSNTGKVIRTLGVEAIAKGSPSTIVDRLTIYYVMFTLIIIKIRVSISNLLNFLV